MGASTLVGAEVINELLRRSDIDELLLLVPHDPDLQHYEIGRLEKYLGPAFAPTRMIPCDLTQPRFGLSLKAWDELATSFDLGFHCAQREINDQDLELARKENVQPIETWIRLLACNPVLRLHHLSTAFVAGTHRGLFTEFDLDCGQQFNDAWERSKFEAEVRLRECAAADRINIYRPSHVLGRAHSGEALEPGGAYPLLATLAKAWILPGDARARIDFVPADYVAASIVALACSGATGTFHLVSGWNKSLPVSEAASLAAQGWGRSTNARLLPRGISWPLQLTGSISGNGIASRKRAFNVAKNRLHQGPVFDSFLADLALKDIGIECPSPADWLGLSARRAAERLKEKTTSNAFDAPINKTASHDGPTEATIVNKDPVFTEKQFHHIGDVNLAFRDIGVGEPVVFLHGFAGAHAWDGVAERIAAHRRVLIIETLGISDSEGPASADFGLYAQAARVRGLLSALDIPAAYIAGNDSGGVIAQMFAVRWPQCVKGLVLSDCDAHGTWPPKHIDWISKLMSLPGATLALAALMRVPAIARSPLGFGKMVYDKRLLTPARLRRYVETVAGNSKRRMHLKRFFRAFKNADLTTLNQMLGEVEIPTMIIWGAENAYWSSSWAKVLYDSIPGAYRLELIPFAGISCHEERPDLFAELLTEFFAELEAEHQVTETTSQYHLAAAG
jgi:pimeloyl-ACP methyl ester carboxylesterase